MHFDKFGQSLTLGFPFSLNAPYQKGRKGSVVAVVASAGRLLCSLHKRTTVHFFRHEGQRKRQAFWTLSNDL